MHAHFDNKLYLTILKDCSCNGNVYVQSVYLTGGFDCLPTFVQVSPTTGSRCCIPMGSGAVGVFVLQMIVVLNVCDFSYIDRLPMSG